MVMVDSCLSLKFAEVCSIDTSQICVRNSQ